MALTVDRADLLFQEMVHGFCDSVRDLMTMVGIGISAYFVGKAVICVADGVRVHFLTQIGIGTFKNLPKTFGQWAGN